MSIKSRPQFKDCNRLEKSFREVLKDKPCGINPAEYVKILKDITHQSFNGSNIFMLPLFDCNGSVKIHENVFRNVYTAREWYDHFGYDSSLYRPYLTGMVIPINIKYNRVFSKARLVIAVCSRTYHYQISVQLLNSRTNAWSDNIVSTNSVREVIEYLTQETM